MVELQSQLQESVAGSRSNGEQRNGDLTQVLFDESYRPAIDDEEILFREVRENVATASEYWTACAANSAVKSKQALKSAEMIGTKGKKRITPTFVETVIEDYFLPLDPTKTIGQDSARTQKAASAAPSTVSGESDCGKDHQISPRLQETEEGENEGEARRGGHIGSDDGKGTH